MAEHAAIRRASSMLHLMALGRSSLPAALACAEGKEKRSSTAKTKQVSLLPPHQFLCQAGLKTE